MIAMPDSIYPGTLPPGFPAYLGYVDGKWPTANQLRVLHPAAHILTLTVLGGNARADGCDCESGDLTPLAAIRYMADELAAGHERPVLYANASTMNGSILPGLAAAHITRSSVRLLSAHYGQGLHICGPRSCGLVTVDMDGTQWTDKYSVPGGTIDMSELKPDFFGTPIPTWTEKTVQQLPTLKLGATGPAARTVQALCCARGRSVILDSAFGPQTDAAVKDLQARAHITADGVVGPQTWPILLGIA